MTILPLLDDPVTPNWCIVGTGCSGGKDSDFGALLSSEDEELLGDEGEKEKRGVRMNVTPQRN